MASGHSLRRAGCVSRMSLCEKNHLKCTPGHLPFLISKYAAVANVVQRPFSTATARILVPIRHTVSINTGARGLTECRSVRADVVDQSVRKVYSP